MNVLEKLFHGEINPWGRNFYLDENYRKQSEVLSQKEDALINLLENKDRQEEYTEYIYALCDLQEKSEQIVFNEGFRLGARIMLETFILSQEN